MNAFLSALVHQLSAFDGILGIGQTGDPEAPLVPGQSDVDLFVLCPSIPDAAKREALYAPLRPLCTDCTLGVCQGGEWGTGDILLSGGIEFMPMYFTIDEMEQQLHSVLNGSRLDREGRFYPSGRLASVEGIHILYERQRAWSNLVDELKARPQPLFAQLYAYHIDRVLDEEDLGRSLLRREVLFFHQVLENALDHFLQALYAHNAVYFPSRKRTLSHLSAFPCKPENCEARLMQLLRDAAAPETLPQAVSALRALTQELRQLS